MSYRHDRQFLDDGDTVVVDSRHDANVMVFNDLEYMRYQSGERCRYLGGFFSHFPVQVSVPTSANWNVVVTPAAGEDAPNVSISFIRSFGV